MWKDTGKWNIKIENILEKRRAKVQENEADNFQKVTLLHGCFSCFLNCTNGTKSHNTSHI